MAILAQAIAGLKFFCRLLSAELQAWGRSTFIPAMSTWDNSAAQLQPSQSSARGNQWSVQAQAQGGGWGPAGQSRRGAGGYGGGGGGQRRGAHFPPANAAHDPYEVRLPNFFSSIAECEDDEEKTSIIMADDRDDRIVSPFQAWLVREIITNSANSVNVLTDRDQVTPPSSGFHLNLFANYTLDGVKATFMVSVDSANGGPCGGWDGPTARALSRPAFLPLSWPMLRDTSPSYMDVKVYNGNEILFHWIFRGYRADTDLSRSSSSSRMSSSCEVQTVVAQGSLW